MQYDNDLKNKKRKFLVQFVLKLQYIDEIIHTMSVIYDLQILMI